MLDNLHNDEKRSESTEMWFHGNILRIAWSDVRNYKVMSIARLRKMIQNS